MMSLLAMSSVSRKAGRGGGRERGRKGEGEEGRGGGGRCTQWCKTAWLCQRSALERPWLALGVLLLSSHAQTG